MCPRCGHAAPIVYRGVVPHCTACGTVRAPLVAPSVNLAGQGARVTGAVAGVVGWIVLGVGWSVSFLVAGIVWIVQHTIQSAAVVGIPMALLFTVIALPFVLGGRSLRRSGVDRRLATRQQAVMSLARHRGGLLTSIDVSQAVGLSQPEAEEVLVALARTQPDRVALEVDDHGTMSFRFLDVMPLPPWPAEGVRIAHPEAGVPNAQAGSGVPPKATRAKY